MSEAVIRFTAGNPTEEEIAAVVAVLSARSAARPAEPEPRDSDREGGWAAYWRTVGAPVRPGPGSWQAAVRGW